MTIRIVTDSTCDLSRELIEKHHITVIPMYIHVGEQSFRDGVELSRQEFYERLPEFNPLPTTAAPGPGIFQRVYEQLAAEGATEILSIHISVKLERGLHDRSPSRDGDYGCPCHRLRLSPVELGDRFPGSGRCPSSGSGTPDEGDPVHAGRPDPSDPRLRRHRHP